MSERMTEKQLLQAITRQGHKISADQLKRWRRADLIPRPVQSHPSGNRGSEATYPPGTLNQLLAVCELRDRFKKLDRIRFELWWAGQHTGDLTHIRAFIVARLERLMGAPREHRGRHEDPFEAAEAAVSGAALSSRDPVLRAMRRFAKTDENLRSAAHAIFWELFGGEVEWESADTGLEDPEPSLAELVEHTTGMHRAKSDELEAGQPLLDASVDIIKAIQTMNLGRVFDLDHPGWAIEQVSDAELEQAREKARILVLGLGSLVSLYAIRRGRDHGGLSLLQGVVAPDPTGIALAMQLVILLPSLLETDQERTNPDRARPGVM